MRKSALVPILAVALGVDVLAWKRFVVIVAVLSLAAVALDVVLAYLLLLQYHGRFAVMTVGTALSLGSRRDT